MPILRFVRLVKKNNKHNLRYITLTTNKAESIIWDRLLLDIIGPYKIRREGHVEPLILEALAIIDLVTRWIRIR